MQRHDDIRSRLDEALRHALMIGAALVLCLPAARGFNETVGWLPLWLLAMPAAALWALRGLPWPARNGVGDGMAKARRRRSDGPQARRRARAVPRRPQSRVA